MGHILGCYRLVSRGPAFSKMPRAWLLDCFALRQMENGETEGAFMTSGSVSATPACATARTRGDNVGEMDAEVTQASLICSPLGRGPAQ